MIAAGATAEGGFCSVSLYLQVGSLPGWAIKHIDQRLSCVGSEIAVAVQLSGFRHVEVKICPLTDPNHRRQGDKQR